VIVQVKWKGYEKMAFLDQHLDLALFRQQAQLSLTNCGTLFCKVVEVLQDFLSENVDKKFTTDYNVA